jgi:tRNA (cmo5U34)-methyltransferase
MSEFTWDPDGYLALMGAEIADYPGLQAHTVAATGRGASRILELGTGTGETARRVLERHPDAALTGVDASPEMLARARERLPAARVALSLGRLQDPLPAGPFDLVVSVLAVHHLSGVEKADLFARIATVLEPGGRFVLGDLVVPADRADAFTEIDGVHDTPSGTAEQLGWLGDAGLAASLAWSHRDLAVLVATARGRS